MLRERVDQVVGATVRRSPRFERFLQTRTATVLAAVMAAVALAGTVAAVSNGEWVDAGVRLLLAAVFGAWTVVRVRQPRSRPPDAET